MDINDEDTKSSSSLKLKRLNKEGWIPFAKLTSLMDALFVFTVAMFIAAPFAAQYPTLVGESPVQEFMGFTGSHPFQESTGRSSSFSGSIAYATITLSLSSSDNFKSMGPCSRVVREQ